MPNIFRHFVLIHLSLADRTHHRCKARKPMASAFSNFKQLSPTQEFTYSI